MRPPQRAEERIRRAVLRENLRAVLFAAAILLPTVYLIYFGLWGSQIRELEEMKERPSQIGFARITHSYVPPAKGRTIPRISLQFRDGQIVHTSYDISVRIGQDVRVIYKTSKTGHIRVLQIEHIAPQTTDSPLSPSNLDGS